MYYNKLQYNYIIRKEKFLVLDKQFYLSYLRKTAPYLNLYGICRSLGLQQSNLSKFIKGDLGYMSVENLDRLYRFITQNLT